ncbi:hypothetical protein BDV93DRAFT_542220 [Ceratobasidium sp. AG-I]|nr:hypothetical protein BDV93DRAFT_542220 [Ceratobasidium sp. AG-I]
MPQANSSNDALNKFMADAYQAGESVDQKYGVPARKKVLSIGSVYPFTTALALVFAALAFVPVFTFLGFSAFILVSFLSTALITAVVLAGAIILGAGLILLSVISIAFGFAVFLTISAFMAYITYRFAFHTNSRDGSGFGAWKAETAMRFGIVDVRDMRTALASSEPKAPPFEKIGTE